MYNSRTLAFSLLATLLACSAQAQSRPSSDTGYYGEVGYAPIVVKSDAGGSATPKAGRFIVGKDLNANLAVEGFFMTTMTKETRVGFDGTTSNYGIALKPKMALTASTDVFARVGWAYSDITASAAGSRTGTDAIYGLGIQSYITPSVYAQLDYMSYFQKDGITAKGYTVSIGTRF